MKGPAMYVWDCCQWTEGTEVDIEVAFWDQWEPKGAILE